MKLVFISDTHGLHDSMLHQIPEGDVLIHSGDVSNVGHDRQLLDFLFWFTRLPHRHKIFIAGNHDFGLEMRWTTVQEALKNLPEGVHYLQDSGVEIEGVKFWGMPWTPEFYNWAFMTHSPAEAMEKNGLIPEDTEVLITHGPPNGVLDTVAQGGLQVGCVELAARLYDLPNVKVHAFGHIHEQYGVKQLNERLYVNASICTLNYRPANKPIVLERYFDSMNKLHYKQTQE